MAFLNSRKGNRKHSCGIYNIFWDFFRSEIQEDFCIFLLFKWFWAANKQVLPRWTEHLAPHYGLQVIENQTETDVATYLHQHSWCSQGSLGREGNTTQTSWEILKSYMELAEV